MRLHTALSQTPVFQVCIYVLSSEYVSSLHILCSVFKLCQRLHDAKLKVLQVKLYPQWWMPGKWSQGLGIHSCSTNICRTEVLQGRGNNTTGTPDLESRVFSKLLFTYDGNLAHSLSSLCFSSSVHLCKTN